MTSKRIGLVTGGLLAGALLLGTAGLVAAQDPTGGMMGGQMGPGMMGGQMGAGMMSGQMGAMSADQLEEMDALHDQMIESGVCDPAQMQAFHAQLHSTR